MLHVITYAYYAYDIDGIAGVVEGEGDLKDLYKEFDANAYDSSPQSTKSAVFMEWLIANKGFKRVTFNEYSLGE